MKTMNTYAHRYPQYDETPKAVVAAVAYSLAMRLCGDNTVDAEILIRGEWDALFENGVVPQKRPIPHKDRPW